MNFRGAKSSRVIRQEFDVVGQMGEDGDQVTMVRPRTTDRFRIFGTRADRTYWLAVETEEKMGLQKDFSTGKGGNQAPYQLGMWVASARMVVRVSEGLLIPGLRGERGMSISLFLSSFLLHSQHPLSLYVQV